MPKFKFAVTDEQGHVLYDEWIEAAGLIEACSKAAADAATVDDAETEGQLEPMRLITGSDGFPVGD